MKKLSKSGIFILMLVTILLQYVSPIIATAQTIGEKVNPVALNTAKIASIGEQDVTVDLQVTTNNSDTQAVKNAIKIQDNDVLIKEVANKTASKNQYTLNDNVISAQITSGIVNEVNDLSIKLSKDSLKGKNSLIFETAGNTTTLDLSQLVQAESAASSSTGLLKLLQRR